jgi:hypothetical protein
MLSLYRLANANLLALVFQPNLPIVALSKHAFKRDGKRRPCCSFSSASPSLRSTSPYSRRGLPASASDSEDDSAFDSGWSDQVSQKHVHKTFRTRLGSPVTSSGFWMSLLQKLLAYPFVGQWYSLTIDTVTDMARKCKWNNLFPAFTCHHCLPRCLTSNSLILSWQLFSFRY